MKLVGDLHTHTIASGHGFSTIQEMAQGAKEKGLKVLGFTEHGPRLPGGPHLYFFYNLRVVPEEINGIRILKGVEANIATQEGELDLPEELLAPLDVVWAGFHLYQNPTWSKAENTRALINTLHNPYVDGIVHPGNPEFPIEIEPVLAAAKETGKVLELNNSSLICRKGSEENCLQIAILAKKMGVTLMVNSDAHISFDVGRCDRVMVLMEKAGLTEKDILNTSVEKINAYLTKRKEEQAKIIG